MSDSHSDTSLPDWVHWLACDADGTWWGYEAEPHRHEHGWYENEIGRLIRLEQSAAPAKDWKNSLTSRQNFK
jgi:hypothetical protein